MCGLGLDVHAPTAGKTQHSRCDEFPGEVWDNDVTLHEIRGEEGARTHEAERQLHATCTVSTDLVEHLTDISNTMVFLSHAYCTLDRW